MIRDPGIEDLSLVVRALHRDVSMLDERLRRLESLIDALGERDRREASAVDLVMLEGGPSRT